MKHVFGLISIIVLLALITVVFVQYSVLDKVSTITAEPTKTYVWEVGVNYLDGNYETIECEMEANDYDEFDLVLTETGSLKITDGLLKNKVVVNGVKKFRVENVKSIRKEINYAY